MSVKEIRDAMENGKVCFGIRQALKLGSARNSVPSKKGTTPSVPLKGKVPASSGKALDVFICKDVRDSTVERLEASGVEFDVLKTKEEVAKELNLDFECEVYSISK